MTDFLAKATIKLDSTGSYCVWTQWTSPVVDRPCTYGCSAGKNKKLAERLARAIQAQVANKDMNVHTDVNGKTYVYANPRYHGRQLNADLKRLGF